MNGPPKTPPSLDDYDLAPSAPIRPTDREWDDLARLMFVRPFPFRTGNDGLDGLREYYNEVWC